MADALKAAPDRAHAPWRKWSGRSWRRPSSGSTTDPSVRSRERAATSPETCHATTASTPAGPPTTRLPPRVPRARPPRAPPSASAGSPAPADARELARAGSACSSIFLTGGVSQLETWDPKPNTDTGGPFRAIPTSVPGTHICELLPHTAKQMHRMALVRGLNTADGRPRPRGDDHAHRPASRSRDRVPAPRGRRRQAARDRHARSCPGHIQIHPKWRAAGSASRTPRSSGRSSPPSTVGDGKPPADLYRPAGLTAEADRQREALRQKLNDRFAKSRAARPRPRPTPSRSTRPSQGDRPRRTCSTSTKERPEAGRPVRPARLRPAPAARPPAARSRA